MPTPRQSRPIQTHALRRALALLALGMTVAQANPGPHKPGENGGANGDLAPEPKVPAVSLLPAGSVLRKVMIPRYDKQRKLTAVLRSETMTIVDPQTIEGSTVSVDLYNPDRSPSGRIDLVSATFDQHKGVLDARQPVDVASENFAAHGTGLVYLYQQAKGFLLGPVNTRFYAPPPKTSMNRPLSPRGAATALATTLIALPAGAETPARLNPGEHSDLAAHAASAATTVAAAKEEMKAGAAKDQAAAAEARADVGQFVEQSGLKNVALPDAAPATAAAPLDVKAGPNDTIIEAKDGMYFDAEKGILVYLKDIHLTDPRFTLSGASELKVFLEKKAEPKKPEATGKPDEKPAAPAKTDLSGPAGNFGDVERIVATGAVRVLQKSTDGKPPIEASAAVLTYHAKTGDIVLNGGYPWVKQGDKFMRAKQPDLYLRIEKDGSFVTEGEWEMGGQMSSPNQPANKPKSKP